MTTSQLPPERRLPRPGAMIDRVVAGAETPPSRGRGRVLVAVAAGVGIIALAVAVSQVVRGGQVAVPADPTGAPSPTVTALPLQRVDLGAGHWAQVAAGAVLESYPEQYVLVGQLCAPAAASVSWTTVRPDGTSAAGVEDSRPDVLPAADCENLRIFRLGTLTAGESAEVRADLAGVPVVWRLTGGPALMPSPGPQPLPTQTPTSTPPPITGSPDTPVTGTPDPRPGVPVVATGTFGGSFALRYFDVAVGELQVDPDGTAWGAHVSVCYVAPHPDANAEGTTRTSLDPWAWFVQDGEGGGPGEWVAASETPTTTQWGPAYAEKALQVGECNDGWVTAAFGNPDLFLPKLRYQPADFGDSIEWTVRR